MSAKLDAKKDAKKAQQRARYNTTFRKALLVVRRSGIAADLENRLRSDKGGRPRQLAVEVLLAACITVFGPGHKTATLVQIHDALTDSLPVSEQLRLGIAKATATTLEPVAIHQVRYLFKAVCRALDYSPTTGRVAVGWTSTDANGYRKRIYRPTTQAERLEREAEAIGYITRLLAASLRPMPEPTVVALDASGIRSHARRVRQTGANPHDDYRLDNSVFVQKPTGGYDPDARSGHVTPTEAKYDADMIFGYQLIPASASFGKDSEFRRLQPIVGLTVVPANAVQTGPALRVLDNINEVQETPLATLVVDRGYTTAVARHWAAPLRARGIEQVLDLTEPQRGPRLDPETGVLMIDGWPYAPWTPENLRHIARPQRWILHKPKPNASSRKKTTYERLKADLDRFRQQHAELAQYALTPNGAPRSNGTRQFKTSRFDAARATAAQRRTKAFRQPTLVLGAAVCPEIRQRLRWGSDEWISAWGRRSAVESGYSNLKGPDTERFERGTIRVVGLIATTLMLAFAAVHYNLRLLTKWAAKNDRYNADPDLLGFDRSIVGYELVTLDDINQRGSPQATAA
ncbi:hypothetical protein CELL_01599 [Cellulomonas sp. T2.31MG-18]|uniref:hypothetical protein n=1 Tax=Cellulomonas sp. T2.31MG-18 TaxID=3157619 RepID=UPI0035E99489